MSNSSVKLDYTNNTCCKKETFSLDLVDFGSQLQIHVIWKIPHTLNPTWSDSAVSLEIHKKLINLKFEFLEVFSKIKLSQYLFSWDN